MPLLHRLRQSASRTGRLLLPLLLLSWLSVFCGNCVAMADMVDMAGHAGHAMPMPPAGQGDQPGHDCCDHAAPCLGGDCDHLQDTAALTAEAKASLSAPLLLALLPQAPFPPGLRAAHPVHQRDTEAIAPLHPPLYLQHCVFLI